MTNIVSNSTATMFSLIQTVNHGSFKSTLHHHWMLLQNQTINWKNNLSEMYFRLLSLKTGEKTIINVVQMSINKLKLVDLVFSMIKSRVRKIGKIAWRILEGWIRETQVKYGGELILSENLFKEQSYIIFCFFI